MKGTKGVISGDFQIGILSGHYQIRVVDLWSVIFSLYKVTTKEADEDILGRIGGIGNDSFYFPRLAKQRTKHRP
jgi:hypothetical protein